MAKLTRTWDDIDALLLDLLQTDADRTLRELGDRAGLSPSAVQRRIARYKSSGLLRTVAVLAPEHTRPAVRALVLAALAEESVEHHRRFSERLRERPEVQQCYAVAGQWDYAVVLAAPDVSACRELGDELFKADANIRRYDTLFVFDTVKAGLRIPADLLRGAHALT